MDDSCEICELNNTSSCCTSWNGLGFLSTIKEKKQEVKKIDCCFIPSTQASLYLKLATNQTLYDKFSVWWWGHLTSETNFASFVSPGHGGAEGWTGSVGGGCCSALVALRSLYSQWQPYCFHSCSSAVICYSSINLFPPAAAFLDAERSRRLPSHPKEILGCVDNCFTDSWSHGHMQRDLLGLAMNLASVRDTAASAVK